MLQRAVRWVFVVSLVTVLGLVMAHDARAKDKGVGADVEAVPVTIDTIFTEPSGTAAALPSEHGTPRVPLVVDGVRYSPAEAHVFDGRPLNFVLDQKALDEGVLYAFTTRQQVREYLESQSTIRPQHTRADYNSYFYENSAYGGRVLSLNVGYAYRDLGGTFWNDRISSLEATPYGSYTILYEHRDYRGATFTIGASVDIPSLGAYGWNDVTSSIVVY